MAIVCSLLSGVPNFFMSHLSVFFPTHPVPCTFRMLPLRKFYSIALPQRRICASFLLPTTGIHLSFWQVQVPYTKSQFQRFRVVHWAVQNAFSFLSLLLTPRISRRVPHLSPYFFALAFPSFYPLFCFRLVPPKLI